jgi:sugar lactone lactonase YvrE
MEMRLLRGFILFTFIMLLVTGVLASEQYAFVSKWGSLGTGDGQFNHPNDVAVDNSGHVYVADSGNNRI